MRKLLFLSFVFPSLLITAACSRNKEQPPAPPQQSVFSYTSTNVVVNITELQTQENENKTLKADFNLDGLSDMAIISGDHNLQNEVDIYIRTDRGPEQISGANPKPASFYHGGTIRRPDNGKIIGLMSGAEGRMVNIILLVSYTNRPNDMIHYRNDGASFSEVP